MAYTPIQLQMGGAAPQQPGAYTPSFGTGSLQDLYTGFNNAYSAAYNANRQRSSQLRGLYQNRLNTMRGLVNTGNAQEMSDIRSGWDAQQAGAMQQATNLGLYSSNITPTMQAGYERQAQNDLGRARERQARMALDYETRLTKEQADQIERETDSYPDLGLLANLAEKMGRGGAGGANPYSGGAGAGGLTPAMMAANARAAQYGGGTWRYTDSAGRVGYTGNSRLAAQRESRFGLPSEAGNVDYTGRAVRQRRVKQTAPRTITPRNGGGSAAYAWNARRNTGYQGTDGSTLTGKAGSPSSFGWLM